MTAEELWRASGLSGGYDAWQFGCDPDGLAALVKAGIKTATASLACLYDGDPDEPLPHAGDRSVILDSLGEAVCIIETTAVEIVPFCDVTAEHAFREGEDDRSLESWRAVHRAFFAEELRGTDRTFDEQTEVVCESFRLLFPAPD